jgi:hypothetical protein
MSRTRLVIAGLVTVALVVMVAWQLARERMMKACLDGGGAWEGSRSTCRPLPGRPILQRDLHRS